MNKVTLPILILCCFTFINSANAQVVLHAGINALPFQYSTAQLTSKRFSNSNNVNKHLLLAHGLGVEVGASTDYNYLSDFKKFYTLGTGVSYRNELNTTGAGGSTSYFGFFIEYKLGMELENFSVYGSARLYGEFTRTSVHLVDEAIEDFGYDPNIITDPASQNGPMFSNPIVFGTMISVGATTVKYFLSIGVFINEGYFNRSSWNRLSAGSTIEGGAKYFVKPKLLPILSFGRIWIFGS